MSQSLASLFKDIADAIRAKKGTTGKIHTSNFVDEILSIGRPATLEYTSDGTLSNLLSNIADAIRVKREITGTIKVENFAAEIAQIPVIFPLQAPEIYFHIEADPGLPDILDGYSHFVFRLDKVKLLSDLPINIPTSQSSIEFVFEVTDDAYHLPESIIVTGAQYTWIPQSTTIGKLVLEQLTSEIDITVKGERYKLETPSIDLYSTITFLNEDGTELKAEIVKHGVTPTYTGPRLTKAGDHNYAYYVHIGWDPWLEPLDGPKVYTAVFVGTNQDKGTITWKNYDGTQLAVDSNIPIGTSITYQGIEPHRPKDRFFTYVFDGWTPRVIPVTGDATYMAVFKEVRNVQIEMNTADGLTYKVLSTGTIVTPNDAGGLTYTIGDVQ